MPPPQPPTSFKPYLHHQQQHHHAASEASASLKTMPARVASPKRHQPPSTGSNPHPATPHESVLHQFQKSRQDTLHQVSGMVQDVKHSVTDMTGKAQNLLNVVQKLQQQQIVLQKQQLLLQQEQKNLIRQQQQQQGAKKVADGAEGEAIARRRPHHRSSESDAQEIKAPINLPWTGRLRILKIVDDDSTFFLEVPCAAYALSIDASMLKREVVSWPGKLIAELIPKALVEKIDQAFFQNSKRVFFDQLKTSEHSSSGAPMSMLHDYVGYIYFPSASSAASSNSVKVIVLKFTASSFAFRGFIPNDQQAFLQQLTKIIQEERVQAPLMRRNARVAAEKIAQQQQPMIASRGATGSHCKKFEQSSAATKPAPASQTGNGPPRQLIGSPLRKPPPRSHEATVPFVVDDQPKRAGTTTVQGPINVLDDQLVQGIVPNPSFVKLLASAVVQELQASTTPPGSPQRRHAPRGAVGQFDLAAEPPRAMMMQQQNSDNPVNYQPTSTLEEYLARQQDTARLALQPRKDHQQWSLTADPSEPYYTPPPSYRSCDTTAARMSSSDDLTQQAQELVKMQQLIRNMFLQGQISSRESQVAQSAVLGSASMLQQQPLLPTAMVRDSYGQAAAGGVDDDEDDKQRAQSGRNKPATFADLMIHTSSTAQADEISSERVCDAEAGAPSSILDPSDGKTEENDRAARDHDDNDSAQQQQQPNKKNVQAEDFTLLSNKLHDYINDLRQQRDDVFHELFSAQAKTSERCHRDMQAIQQKLQEKKACAAQELQDNQEIINNFNRKVDMFLDRGEIQEGSLSAMQQQQQHEDQKFQADLEPVDYEHSHQQQQQQSVEDDDQPASNRDKSKKCVHIDEANNQYYMDEFEFL